MTSLKHHSCTNCLHCHLYHIEKDKKKYYCLIPGKKILIISNPKKLHSYLCEHYVYVEKTLTDLITSVCDRIHVTLLDDFDSGSKNQIASSVSMNKILKKIIQLEKEGTVFEVHKIVDFYFDIASNSVLKIAELERI